MTKQFKIGDRVVMQDGSVGHIEEIDDDGDGAGVRVLTPKNEPSCSISWTWMDNLKDGTGILPQPRSKEWWAEARAFHAGIRAALLDA